MKKPPDTTLAARADYRQFVEELKTRVTSARIFAARRINHDMIFLYGEHTRLACRLWRPRRRQAFQAIRRGFRRGRRKPHAGARVLPKISHLPNPVLRATRATSILRQAVAEIPWGQNLLILNKLSDPTARLWYLRATARFGWSRNVLLNQIKAGAYERAVTEKKTHNFDLALPEHFAEQAEEMLKSFFYLNRLNDKERGPDDQPSIGIAAYALQSKLPGDLKGKLPTAKQLADIVRAEMEGGK